MAKFLTIDNGNSSTKAAIWSSDDTRCGDIVALVDGSDVEHLAAIAGESFERVAICSVADLDLTIAEAAARLSRREPIDVGSTTPVPVDLSLYAGTTLGADRIAALAGARGLFPDRELLVVDYGTCITYDRLSADGVFLGGVIAPGVKMRLKAMHAFTSRLPQVDPDADYSPWGRSTAGAMHSGALGGAVAELEYYNRLTPADAQIVVTGGAAANVVRNTELNVYIEPDLVLLGLKNIILYNENL